MTIISTASAPCLISRRRYYSEQYSDQRLKRLRLIGALLFYGSALLRRPYRPFVSLLNVARGRQESRSEMGLVNVLRRNRLTEGKVP